jgi:hypothetical protein
MSDNEEYYDEFDDDDIFWIEEADPTVAVCLPTLLSARLCCSPSLTI